MLSFVGWMCRTIPLAFATDCKSVYNVCSKSGSIPDEKRVALDLLDLKESISIMGDQIWWIPTDHMLADSLTKNMPTDDLIQYLRHMDYSLKYDEQLAETKRSLQKQRKKSKEQLS